MEDGIYGYMWLMHFFCIVEISNIVNHIPLKEKKETWAQRTPAMRKLEMVELPVKGDTQRNRQFGMLNLEQIYHVKSAHSFPN